jgi:hypothetical protein
LARQKYYSTEQIKIRILVYLYHQDEGANKNNIQERAIRGRHTQEGSRVRKILEDQCTIGTIEQIDMSHVTQGRVIYKITDKGRKIIESLREPHVKEFFGSADEDFCLSDKKANDLPIKQNSVDRRRLTKVCLLILQPFGPVCKIPK